MTRKLFRDGVSNSLWSEDLAAVEPEGRTWTAWGVAWMWAAMAWSLPMYLLASAMTVLGMNEYALLEAVLVGSIVVMFVAVGCGHAGTRYGIPFAVLARVAFGVSGANVSVALRVLVGCGWLAIGCRLGAESLFGLARMAVPTLPAYGVWACFAVILLAAAGVPGGEWRLFTGVGVAALVLLLVVGELWLSLATHGAPALLHTAQMPSVAFREVPRAHLMALALTATIGLLLPVAMGSSDMTRRARLAETQGWWTAVLPVASMMVCAVAVVLTHLVAARGLICWNPVLLMASFRSPLLALPGLLAFVAIAVLTARPLARWLGGQIAALPPATLTPRVGRWVACGLAACASGWLLGDPFRYVGVWLGGCAGLLAPVAAILMVEYFVLRRGWLNTEDLYQRDGLYEYSDGWNHKALGALLVGWAAIAAIYTVPALNGLSDGAVWVGTGLASGLYWLLRSGPMDVAQIPPTPLLIPLAGFEGEEASG